MIATLTLNALVVLTIIVGLVSTHNDLFVLGLLMLKELPQYPPAYVLQMQYALQKLMGAFSDEEPRRPIGFTADIDVEPGWR
ncbi:hypothetical protein PQQ87_08550 [Paraburkholderia nemoris]|uniref:hypothetical protein n=1 Tax=Paraburkholderia nemoris TaxID=2793076 RepID=UPI0038B7E85F